MKVFLNPGHSPNGNPDPGAVGFGMLESDVTEAVTKLVEGYLAKAGVEVVANIQSNDLTGVVNTANASGADVFISIHCNSATNPSANGTEVFVYKLGNEATKLAQCIQDQITDALDTTDRGVREDTDLYVLNSTSMTAVLVELAFICNESDNYLLRYKQDEFARAIARGVTDYQRL